MKILMDLGKSATLLLILIVVACNKDSTEAPVETLFEIQGENGFVGTVDGTDAFIALLIADEEAIVYVCNGEEEISEWFRGSINDPENISLSNSSGAKVTGKFAGNTFSGTLTLSNKSEHSYTAAPNTGSETGIFRIYGDLATQEEVVAGWILNAESEERGSLRFKSVFQTTPKKPKIKDINDGTSNTLMFNSKSFPIGRFFFIYHPDSVSVIQRNG